MNIYQIYYQNQLKNHTHINIVEFFQIINCKMFLNITQT